MSAAPVRHPRPIAPGPRPAVRTSPSAKPAPGARTQPQRRAKAATQTGARGHLRAVQAPEQARTLVPFAWTCALIIIGALSAVLLVNTSMACGAYERRDLKIEIANLHEQRATLVTKLEQQSAPAQLGTEARRLGMEPAEQFGFLSLADSVVIESGDK